MNKKYAVFKSGQLRFKGTYDECFAYILNHQPQSISWALCHGGWAVDEISGETNDNQTNNQRT